MKINMLPKLLELPLLPYFLDGNIQEILSLNDSAINKGNYLFRKDELNIADMNIHLCRKYDDYSKDSSKKNDLISAYNFIVKQLQSQLIIKEDICTFIENLTDKQFSELSKQVDTFYEICNLANKK